MKTFKIATLTLALFGSMLTAVLAADTFSESELKQRLEARLEGGAKIESVTKTPYAELYEVRTNNGEVIYTDAKAQYLFIGHVVDAQTHQDYTQARIDDINKIKFSDLPLDLAIKMVKGKGERVLAVFEDPNCGYCKRFRQTLKETDNITVYTFMYNILSVDSSSKSRNVWCSADRAKAWDDWMLEGKAAEPAAAGCTDPNDKVFELGKKLKVTGTPTVFFADGSRVPGAVDAQGLESKLAGVAGNVR